MGTWKKVTTSADDSTHKNDNITFAQLFIMKRKGMPEGIIQHQS